MNALGQIRAVTAIALRSTPRRLGTSLVVVIGTATTVAVLISALAIATGFARAATKGGRHDRVIVLEGLNEGASDISRTNATAIAQAPGVVRTATGSPEASSEVIVSVALTDFHTGRDAYVTVRGIGPEAFKLRPEISLVAGRLFIPGRREVIVGEAIAQRVGGLAIGSSITLPDGPWKVVGTFSSGGGSSETEIQTDATSLMNAYSVRSFNSVTVRLALPTDFARFSAALAANPMLSVKPQREDEYYATISRPISQVLKGTAYCLGGIVAFGAIFGALNMTFSAVRARRTEIATLRAIGFGALAVVSSVLFEALVLGLVGTLLGTLTVRLLLSGARISTLIAPGTPLHLTFDVELGPRVVIIGVLFALGIALTAGVFAARQAVRVSIAVGMRET